MDNHISFRHAVKMLEQQGMMYHILDLGGKWKTIVTQYGGRLLGPFDGDAGESLLWINSAIKDPDAFTRFVAERSWNLGGERVWINPELRFFCDAPESFDETYTVQGELDPGHYAIQKDDDGVSLFQTMQLKDLYNGGTKRFQMKRRYAAALNPLRCISELQHLKIDYCGYTQDIELKDDMPSTKMYLEPWILTQINPAGKCVTPFFGPFDFVDYYDPVGDMQKIHDGYAELDITGVRKYKVAYRSAQTFGRMAYVKEHGKGVHLMVRNYYNDPSIPYCSEPWGNLGNKGCSAFYYNDNGSNGGFAEFENSCATIGLDAKRSHSCSTTSLWFFFGSQKDIGRVMKHLLGVDYQF